jgi:poly-gamma-glutamate synthesis protein (capsule biosynthesis protein)
LYGCGDFINDYEGIGGYEEYRDDLSVMYLPSVNEASGVLEALTLVLFQKHRFRLRRASFEDASWFHTVMNKECRRFATRLSLDGDGSFNVAPV